MVRHVQYGEITLKKIKKATTFGQKGKWQLEYSTLLEIAKDTEKADYRLTEETLEDIILSLNRLGYIDLEEA